jgi:hypothetical protein
VSYPNLVAGQIVTADGLNVDASVVRLVDGRTHTGSLVDTNTTSGTYAVVTSSNPQNTGPLIAGRAYRADVQVGVQSTVANDRMRFSIWDGTVGGTQLGSFEPIVRCEAASNFKTFFMSFVWPQLTDTTISNVNLGHQRFSGTGTCTTRIEVPSFLFLIYDIGPTSRIQNL